MHGIKMDWTLNCACHGKNKVDPENGAAKNLVISEMLTETDVDQARRIESALDASKFLKQKFVKPYDNIFEKKGLGILKRVVFYVPATGPGSIDRNIKSCKTLKGSKPYRQFTDVGVPGVLDIRLGSCHECAGCRTLVARSACINTDVCGPVERVQLEPESVSERRMTRHALQQLGAALAETISEDNVIAVELTHESEVFMLGIVVPGPDGEEGPYRVMEHSQSYMGRLEPGDRVIQVRKFEPTQLGSNSFRLTEKEFPVFIEDVRLILDTCDLVSDGTPQRRVSVRTAHQDSIASRQLVGGYDPLLTCRLSAESKEAILKCSRGINF